MALFNKDWETYKRNWQNANGIGGKLGSIFTPANAITKSDIEAIKAYNSQIDACVTSQTAFNRTMLNASPVAQNLVASYNGGKVSAQGMATAQNAAKNSTLGLTVAQMALNAAIGMGIGLLINLVVQGVNKLIHANEEAIEKAEELRGKYEEFKNTNASNVNTLKGLESEFKELSKGVSQYGDNISLTTDQYGRYKEIIQQIVGMSPSLAEGYDTENGYIADKNGLLERAIELQEIEYRNELRKITNLENLKTSMSGYIAEYKDALNGGTITAEGNIVGTTIDTDFRNSLWQLFNTNNRENYDSQSMAKDIMEALGVKDIDAEMQKYLNENGYWQDSSFWNDYCDTIIENLDAVTNSISFDEAGLDEEIFDQNLEKLESYAESYRDMKDSVEMANSAIQTDLGYIAEYADGYSELSTEQQKFVSDFLKGFDISDISSENAMGFLEYDNDKMASVKSQIKKFVEELSQDETTKKALADLYAIPTDEQSISEFVEQFRSALEIIKVYCEENGIEIPIAISDSEEAVNELEAQYKRAVDFSKDKFDGYDPTAFFKENSINTQEEVDKWLEIAQAVNSATDAEKKYVQGSTLNNESDILPEDRLEELREQADQLSSIINEIQSSYDTLQSAIEEYNEQGYLSLDTLNSLLSLDDEYLACLVNENGQLSLNADAMNALAQSKLNEAEASAVAEAMTELYAIANGEVASSTANYISGNANLMQSLALLAGQYDNVANAAMTAAQAQELSAMIEKANAKDGAATARVMSGLNSRLGLIHSTASSIKTRNVGGISNKKSSGSGSASSVDTWKDEFQAQYDLLKHNLEMEYITEEQYYGALNALNEKYFANNAKYTDEYRKYQEEVYKGLQKVYKEYIENQMSYLEKALAANKISFSHYSSAVKTMLDDMWKEGKISAEDYWSYVEKMLKQQLDIYDSVINAATNLLDKEIDKIQNEIDALEDKNDALNKQLDQYDGILAIVDDVYDAEIERIREQQDAIDDTIDKLQKENDEKQRGIELEKARYQLYKSLNQRNVKLFNGQEFVYTTNRDEVREAQQNLADLEFDQTIDALEKERDALDAEIEKLEEFKEKWADITEAYDNEINKQLAIALWGKDYESIILSNRISDIENFKDEYTSIQAQIDDNQSMIDSYNEKIEYYENLKEQWSDISKVYDEERDKLYASQILGAQWEKDILSGRLDLLNNFKEQYVLLQQQMAEAAVNSANAIIEANNRINSSTTSVPSSPFSGGSSGGGGTSTPAPAPVDPHPDKYWVYKTLGTYSTSGEASSKIGMLGGDQVIKVGSKYLVVKWKKGYTTQGEASSHISFLGGNGVYKRYAKGTINARKGLHLVSEDKYGDEIILRNNGTAVVAKGEQFYPFEGGETVINASDTKKLLANMDNLVPLHDSANPFARLKLQPIDSNAMVMNHLNLPNYNNLLPVNRDSSTTISIGDIHLHEVQNANTLANSIIRELPGKVIQRLGK